MSRRVITRTVGILSRTRSDYGESPGKLPSELNFRADSRLKWVVQGLNLRPGD